jgi:hypothetical protein
MNLQFKYFEQLSDKLKEFVIKNKNDIDNLIKKCFKIEFVIDTDWLVENDFFFMIDKDTHKIVALALTKTRPFINLSDHGSTYKLITFSEDENKIISESKIFLNPVIETLCRNTNPKYKGIGSKLLDNIIDHYKKKGTKRIYLVPESARYKSYEKNGQCGYDNQNKDYLISQKELHRYYNKYGFKMLEDFYDIDICDHDLFSGITNLVMFPVFYKDLTLDLNQK